ncbi:uncharacterized protein E0L32_012124 [Thyridium curvatum]|uniref:Serine-threonine rich protein n=1 Tax=Thyridium curvatum TaxID=1093900 RepID=A0A507BKE1_9PEZI|nr:uncharacterized protein E0L32_012124 [Thyridium curvatum]TPX17561.1 hypothetical protein E0L32_012124 [Thyridium curvatum]
MLTTVSNGAPQARMLHLRTASLRILGPTSAALIRHRQQVRGFRFGFCSTPRQDYDLHREMRRHHRAIRQKYAENLHRKLSWEQPTQAKEVKQAFKQWARHYGQLKEARRYRTPSNPTGVRPGSNIEDVERGAMEHLFFGDRGSDQSKAFVFDHWTAPFQNLRNFFAHQQAQNTSQDYTSAEAYRRSKRFSSTGTAAPTTASADDFVIDPITNRRVPRVQSRASPVRETEDSDVPADFPFLATDAQKSQIAQEPIFYDGPPPAGELKQYKQVKIDEVQDGAQLSSGSEPVIEIPPSPEELKQYGQIKVDDISSNPAPLDTVVQDADLPPTAAELRQYGQVRIDNIDFAPEATVSHASETGHLRWKYTGVLSGAPPAESGIHNITAAMDAVPQPTKSSLNKAIEELKQYKPVMHNEDAQAEPSQQYSDLHKYKPVMTENDTILQQEAASPYEDLHKYTPVMYNEPDGKPPGYVEREIPPELHLYKPFLHNEPDGKAPEFDQPSYDPAELAKYQAVRWNEPDGQPLVTEQADKVDPAELAKYTAVRYNEPDGKPLDAVTEEPPAEELNKYGPVAYNEPDGKPKEADMPVDPVMEPVPEELEKYGPVAYNEGGRPVPLSEDVPTINEGEMPTAPEPELQKYGEPVKYNEPDGKPAAKASSVEDALREFDEHPENSWVAEASAPAEMTEESFEDVMGRLRKMSLKPAQETQPEEDLDSLRASDVRAAAGIATAAKPSSKDQMTGNFARDFPEEFAAKWTRGEPSASALTSTGSTSAVASAAQKSEPSTARTYASAAGLSRIEPSLDRQTKPFSRRKSKFTSMTAEERRLAQSDPYSTAPQGLETSYAEETEGQQTWPTFVKIYSGKTKQRDNKPPQQQQQVYKILAYDPSAQAVSTAETTSVVPDAASPLTPAEALLRLSNPTKFLPHFAPLRAQGFEIVSGKDDVLVFRKVRDADSPSSSSSEPQTTTTGSAEAEAALTQQEANTTIPAPSESNQLSSAASHPPPPAATAVNPIDMMGARRFASPTGYVNYEELSPLAAAAAAREEAPAFRSNIDVRREEPVFSGAREEQQWQRQQQRHRPRRARKVVKRVAVGAAWVAGISYALGVVGEYFRSGGADGLGPRGL